MKILVTGGAGFIGSHTVVALHTAGFEPVILDNYSNALPSVLTGVEKIIGQSVKAYTGDCNDATILSHIFERENIAGVIHFAAFKAVGKSMQNPLKYYHNNIGSLVTLLQVMLDRQVPHLIFSSSCTVYGEPDRLPVTEETPVKPASSVYGNTKQICEGILSDMVQAGQPFNIISLRYFNPVGAHSSGLIGELPLGIPANLVPFVTQAAAGLRGTLTVNGDDYDTPDGTCIRDYIHVMDLAEAHVAALRHLTAHTSAPHYGVYNVGTGTGVSVLEVIQTFESVTGVKVPWKAGPRRIGDVVSVYADVTKARTQLGWQTTRTVRDALRDAWRWQQTLSAAEQK